MNTPIQNILEALRYFGPSTAAQIESRLALRGDYLPADLVSANAEHEINTYPTTARLRRASGDYDGAVVYIANNLR